MKSDNLSLPAPVRADVEGVELNEGFNITRNEARRRTILKTGMKCRDRRGGQRFNERNKMTKRQSIEHKKGNQKRKASIVSRLKRAEQFNPYFIIQNGKWTGKVR